MDAHKGEYLSLSMPMFRRLPQYYNYLKLLREQGIEKVSAPIIAKRMNLNDVQVRKDLAAVSESGGKPRTGFYVNELLACIERCLGYNNIHDAVLVGAGQLGSALLSYGGFEECGIKIVAAFDNNEARIGGDVFEKKIYPTEKLENLCCRLNIRIGIITVPASAAQAVCDMLIESGILAIWNFAPVHLVVPEHILVQNENMAISLALLSQHLSDKI